MNTQRILVLGGAFVAAILVAFLVSHLLGGGTQSVKASLPPPRIASSEVLVAATNLSPGVQMTPASVRWQEWPKSNVDSSFITHDANPDLSKVVTGAVVRAPMVSGEPLNASKFVQHSQAAGYMAAIVSPGMRAISIAVTTESGAGGFILPNDRVDVISTQQASEAHKFHASTLLNDVRVLAVDQVFEQKDQKTVLARTATLELSPSQAETVARAQASGTLALALRPLGESAGTTTTLAAAAKSHPESQSQSSEVSVIRYGIERQVTIGQRE